MAAATVVDEYLCQVRPTSLLSGRGFAKGTYPASYASVRPNFIRVLGRFGQDTAWNKMLTHGENVLLPSGPMVRALH